MSRNILQFAKLWCIIYYGKGVTFVKKSIKDYLLSCGVEYFSVLKYSDCIETNKRIIDRCGFEPKTVIIYLLPYYAGKSDNLSIYSSSLDYHLIIKEINDGLSKVIKSFYPESNTVGYGDHSPIDERHAALSTGLGIAGKNGLVINEKYGSFVFIGDIVCDIDPEILGAEELSKVKCCSGCGKCLAACPTGILRGEGNDCLSAITQRKGELTEDECDLMRKYNTAWGCDICQTACPYNKDPKKTPIEFFYRDRIPSLSREILDSMTDEEFKLRAFAWRKRATVERNLDILENKK